MDPGEGAGPVVSRGSAVLVEDGAAEAAAISSAHLEGSALPCDSIKPEPDGPVSAPSVIKPEPDNAGSKRKSQRSSRRLSRRMSMAKVSDKVTGWHCKDGKYKLYVSDTDRERPFFLKAPVFERLYDYQRDGVRWLWDRYCAQSGGLLGDDMGLGKTIQIISFLNGMFHAQRIKYALIVMPVSLLENWCAEFERWAPKLLVERLHEVTVERRKRLLRQLHLYGGVCVTSYGLITSNVEVFEESRINWDYIILDEGHKVKNPSIKLSKNVRKIEAKHRVILSGTPIQNNLTELWSLFDFICMGKLLGSQAEFKSLIADKISRGHERCAATYDKIRGEEMARTLRDLIQPFFLRRDKKMVPLPLHSP